MRACVRCGALRPAPAQLRGAARLLSVPQRVAPASRGSRGAGRRARLEQGCAAQLAAAAAAEGEPRPAAPQLGPAAPRGRGRPRAAADGEAAPLVRRPRAPYPKHGEKTADGKPKPDERTVAHLVDIGWFKTEKEVVVLLTRGKKQKERYPFETAEPAADWLESTLGPEPVVRGLCPAARAVKSQPLLLAQDTATLQRNWDALTLSAEQGGVGCMLSASQAREAVCKFPPILGYTEDNLRSGWSMLTAAEGGLGLTHNEARKCILLNRHVLTSDFEKFTKRVELLRSLGYADAHSMVLAASAVLNYKDETVIEHAAWWRQTGLDHLKLITIYPTLLGSCSTPELQAKLDFLRDVARLSDTDLNHGAPFLLYSLEDRLRPRFFYALQHGALERNKLSTLTVCSDAVFSQRVHRLDAPASADAVKRYKEAVSSAAFLERAAQEEAKRRQPRA